MKKRCYLTFIGISFVFSLWSQSVYMHEAQREASKLDGLAICGFFIFIIITGIIWFTSICIKDHTKSKRKDQKKKEEEERKRQEKKRHEQIQLKEENLLTSLDCNNYIQIDEYRAIDLGLPSKNLWATDNIGAPFFSCLGDIFAWGNNTKIDKDPIHNIFYTPLQFVALKKEINDLCIEGSYSGISKYDAATKERGHRWRTPTVRDIKEILEFCSWEFVSSNSIKGWKVKGSNGNFIFFPIRTDFLLDRLTPYLTGSQDPDDSKYSECELGKYNYGMYLVFNRVGDLDKYTHEINSLGRIRGGYIRPVATLQ